MEALIEEIVRKLHHLPEVKILEVLDYQNGYPTVGQLRGDGHQLQVTSQKGCYLTVQQ